MQAGPNRRSWDFVKLFARRIHKKGVGETGEPESRV